MRSKAFWIDAAERAIRTFAQALIGAITAGLVVTDAAQWKAAGIDRQKPPRTNWAIVTSTLAACLAVGLVIAEKLFTP